MKISSGSYVVIKIIFILVAIYLFLHPEVFASKGYDLAIDGIVVCRGLSLICAIYIGSSLLDNMYRDRSSK